MVFVLLCTSSKRFRFTSFFYYIFSLMTNTLFLTEIFSSQYIFTKKNYTIFFHHQTFLVISFFLSKKRFSARKTSSQTYFHKKRLYQKMCFIKKMSYKKKFLQQSCYHTFFLHNFLSSSQQKFY